MTRRSACVTICILAGCASSPPIRFYTLTEVAAPARLTAPAATARIRLDRVVIPSEVDRLQLVRRAGPTQLHISETQRWAAPLDEMIARVLTGDLAARLPANLVADLNEPAFGERRQSVTVDIQEFYPDAACRVSLLATWVLKQQEVASQQGRENIEVAADGDCADGAAQAQQMSRALGQLSDRVAAAVIAAAARSR